MVLDDNIRGTLENEIDKAIKSIPGLISLARREDFKKQFQIKEESDLAVGLTWGYILRAFQDIFILDHNRPPNKDEMFDAFDIVFRRTKEIKEAIFKCG